MKRLIVLAAAVALTACATPTMLAYSSGFSFSPYEYIVVGKPDGRENRASSSLYGLDVQLANLLTRYNMRVVGDLDYQEFSAEDRAKTLFARMSLEASSKRIVLSVSFDDAVSGRTGASITSYEKGKLFELDERTKAFEKAAKEIVAAFERDKGLRVSGSGKR